MISDLTKGCGLKIKLNTDKPELTFAGGINFSMPGVRTLQQMREVLMDKKISRPQELYYMYRDVYAKADKPLLDRHGLRFDVTVIRPDMLGRELMKTAGHYHPGDFGELYEVVSGRCCCLLQRHKEDDFRVIEEVIAVEAQAGDKIVIPPKFGHILINPGPGYLVTSNWVSSRFSSEYELYKKAGGAAYFCAGGPSGQEFVANPFFKGLPGIKLFKAAQKIERFGLISGEPMYPLIKADAEKLEFLNRPLDFDYGDVFVKA